MLKIIFNELWDNHPLNQNPSENFPCRNADGTIPKLIENQCAVKMSVALTGAKVDLSKCTAPKCWIKGHKAKHHILAAQRLADWLALPQHLSTPSKMKKGKNKEQTVFHNEVVDEIKGKKGIVFCQNFWGTNNQGDHIDVWDGTVMGGKLQNDYFGRSQQVWFWEITL